MLIWVSKTRSYKNTPEKYVRQKEVDLAASLKSGEIDYAWNHESVALQNNFKYVDLPDQIDFSNKNLRRLVQDGKRCLRGQAGDRIVH